MLRVKNTKEIAYIWIEKQGENMISKNTSSSWQFIWTKGTENHERNGIYDILQHAISSLTVADNVPDNKGEQLRHGQKYEWEKHYFSILQPYIASSVQLGIEQQRVDL